VGDRVSAAWGGPGAPGLARLAGDAKTSKNIDADKQPLHPIPQPGTAVAGLFDCVRCEVSSAEPG